MSRYTCFDNRLFIEYFFRWTIINGQMEFRLEILGEKELDELYTFFSQLTASSSTPWEFVNCTRYRFTLLTRTKSFNGIVV